MIAKIIGRGKEKTMFRTESVKVFRKALQKAGSLKNNLKYLSPTHSVPKGPSPGRYRLKARIFPNIGIYLKRMK
ncbi:MAG: hypothetical protein PHH94_00455 [Sphaerochaetaceae bacterium]|nr:hypothetical protein [Sphaerochaetaceae bacterium]